METFKFILINSFIIMACHAQPAQPQSSWYTSEQQGWLWYKRVPTADFVEKALEIKENEQERDQEKLTKRKISESEYVYTKRLELARKNFDEVLAKAVVEPTLENIHLMQQAQNVLQNRATQFSKLWMISSLLSGNNFRGSDQANPQHRRIYQDQLDRELDNKIRNLSQTHGLFFIFKEDCPYCHEFAPTVKKLMNLYGFQCKAISSDGKPLPLFSETETDNGTIGMINPEGIFPSLFLVNPQTRQIIPLARGLVSLSQLRDNFKIILQYLEESNHVR